MVLPSGILNTLNVITNLKVPQDTHSQSGTTWMLLMKSRGGGMVKEAKKLPCGEVEGVKALPF